MTLAEARALPAPGTEVNPKRRIGCLDEPGLADHMVGLMKSDVAKEASVGVLTCTIVEPDPMNPSYWAPALVRLDGADATLWLPFISLADGGQRLAQIAVYPNRKKDESKLLQGLTAKLGQPKAGSRAFVAMMSGAAPEPVSTWQSGAHVIDATKNSMTYYYDPALTKDLNARLSKLPGRSFLYAVPQ